MIDGPDKDNRYSLRYYDSVCSTSIGWLWYPYIPYGKITILQGDPGEGKTTLMLQLAAMMSSGRSIPDGLDAAEPQVVIFQGNEDGHADTIKPRLEAAGADCKKVAFIQSKYDLSLSEPVFGDAIRKSGARLLIIDPLQAFIGNDKELLRPGGIREAFRELTWIAEETGCAIVMISHMNKNSHGKSIYRGLGSIDVAAVARSVLMLERDREDSDVRVLLHIKSSLAPEGSAYAFRLDPSEGFSWIGETDYTVFDFPGSTGIGTRKLAQAKFSLEALLYQDQPANDIMMHMEKLNIGKRTVDTAKKELGIYSYRKGGSWYWHLPDGNGTRGLDSNETRVHLSETDEGRSL